MPSDKPDMPILEPELEPEGLAFDCRSATRELRAGGYCRSLPCVTTPTAPMSAMSDFRTTSYPPEHMYWELGDTTDHHLVLIVLASWPHTQ